MRIKKMGLLSIIFCLVAGSASSGWAQGCTVLTCAQSCSPAMPPDCDPIVWTVAFFAGLTGPVELPMGTICCVVPFATSCITPRGRACFSPKKPTDICTSCNSGGSPINFATGNTYIVESDISLPGLGGGLKLTRTWNSIFPATQAAIPNMFGINWRSTYEESLQLTFTVDDPTFKYARGDGSVWSFGLMSQGPDTYQPIAPANDTTTIVTGSTSYIMTFKSGERRLFAFSTGLLTSIIDRNGNTTQLTYDGQNRLTTVTDAASRHLNFTYVSSSSNLVSSVSSDAGVSYSYTYDNQGRLSQVTKPDGTTVNFTYDNNNMLTAVTDSQGKVLESHTYDASGRGLTSSRANGVDSVTVTYPQ